MTGKIKKIENVIDDNVGIVVRSDTIYANNQAHVGASKACPSVPGYTAIGIAGWIPQGGWAVGENISSLSIDRSTQTFNVTWSTNVSTSQYLIVLILYAKNNILKLI
jgi:hypothetical protein